MFPKSLLPIVEAARSRTLAGSVAAIAAVCGLMASLSIPSVEHHLHGFDRADANRGVAQTRPVVASGTWHRGNGQRPPVRFGAIADPRPADAWLAERAVDVTVDDHLALLQAKRQLREAKRARSKQPVIAFIRGD